MAWLLTINSDDDNFMPKIVPDPECVPYKIKAEYRERYGFNPSGMHAGGYKIEDRFWPVSGRFQSKVEAIPRLMGVCSFFLVPQAWRDIIELFEPGVHPFRNFSLFDCDGISVSERFYSINIRQAHHDVADRERSKVPFKDYADRKNVFSDTSKTAKIYFIASKLGAFHLWCPREVLIYQIAMSNELFAAISESGGMDTVKTLQIQEV